MSDLKRYDMQDTNPGYDPAYRMVADEHGDWVAFEDAEELQTELTRLRHDLKATCDGLALMSEKYMTEKIQHEKTKTRNERLELLVRLMTYDTVEVWPHELDSEGDPKPYMLIFTMDTKEHLEVTYTNGIPDLTDEQWERLAKLERGEA